MVEDVRLCVREAVANAIRHAYGSRTGTVELRLEISNGALTVLVKDRGRGLATRSGKGYGLGIMESLADRCVVSSIPGTGTEVAMTFALSRAVRERRPWPPRPRRRTYARR